MRLVEYSCKECSFVCNVTRTFTLHVEKSHHMLYKDYVIKHFYNGIHPLCRCGCENLARWHCRTFKRLKGHRKGWKLTPDELITREQKRKKTCLRLYGTEHHFANVNVTNKRNKTLNEKYGDETTNYTNISQIPQFKFNLNTKDACQKRHENMKARGTYCKSKTEDAFYEKLCFIFNDVKRQLSIKTWSIDLYVKDIETYIQFDGIYWHGLDKSFDELSQSSRDIVIKRHWKTDREQEQWFIDHNLRFIRIADKDFQKNPDLCLKIINDLTIQSYSLLSENHLVRHSTKQCDCLFCQERK